MTSTQQFKIHRLFLSEKVSGGRGKNEQNTVSCVDCVLFKAAIINLENDRSFHSKSCDGPSKYTL